MRLKTSSLHAVTVWWACAWTTCIFRIGPCHRSEGIERTRKRGGETDKRANNDKFGAIGLRTYATKYFPCWNIFNTLHTVCFMHGLSIYEIKRICHHAYFFTISYGSFQHLTNFLKIWKKNASPKYRPKSVVIFSQLLFLTSISAHDIKPFRKCASLVFITCFDKILHDIFWQFVENWN